MLYARLTNEFYSRDISKKVKTAKMARARNGHCLAAYPAYGYIRVRDSDVPYAVDETAAPVVRRIFALRCEGRGYRNIASVLNSDHIDPPRTHYYKLQGKESPRRLMEIWSDVTVRDILKNEIYIGNLVQFKSTAISYKNRRQRRRPQEEWIRTEHTHEPLITMEQWNKAQELAAKGSVYRSGKAGKVYLFSGLLECADCHGGMKICRDSNMRKDGHRNNHHAYVCCTYSRGGPHACTTHRILESSLKELVLSDLKEKAERICIDEDKVVEEIKRKMNSQSNSQRNLDEKELNAVRNRLSELDRLIQKIYEEMALGDIPRETMLTLMEKYRREQAEKQERAAALVERITHSKEVDYDIQEWVSLMKRYMGIEELDRELLIKLIDKIVVGQKKTVDGEVHQDITIIYNLVGQVD